MGQSCIFSLVLFIVRLKQRCRDLNIQKSLVKVDSDAMGTDFAERLDACSVVLCLKPIRNATSERGQLWARAIGVGAILLHKCRGLGQNGSTG